MVLTVAKRPHLRQKVLRKPIGEEKCILTAYKNNSKLLDFQNPQLISYCLSFSLTVIKTQVRKFPTLISPEYSHKNIFTNSFSQAGNCLLKKHNPWTKDHTGQTSQLRAGLTTNNSKYWEPCCDSSVLVFLITVEG